MKRILITGATGFVGRACLDLLCNQDWEIHAVSRRAISESGMNIEWHRADLKDFAIMRAIISEIEPTHLLHAAWCTDPKSFWHSAENHEWLRSTVELFDCFAAAGGTRIVGVGSCAEYDWTMGVCREQKTPCRPNTLYGQAKLSAANHLATMQQQGLSTAWARLFFMYGPGASESRMPGAVISALQRNEPALCSAGEQRRDFLYIDDVASALVAILGSTITGPVNICSGEVTSIGVMAERVAELMGKRELLKLGALPTRVDDPSMIVGHNSRLKGLGWQPQFSLEQGLQQTITRSSLPFASIVAA